MLSPETWGRVPQFSPLTLKNSLHHETKTNLSCSDLRHLAKGRPVVSLLLLSGTHGFESGVPCPINSPGPLTLSSFLSSKTKANLCSTNL